MDKMDKIDKIEPNQPMYMYQMPMFMVTVSAVVIVDNGVIMIPLPPDANGTYPQHLRPHKFPGGVVRAGLETVQFACVRYIKEQAGIVLKKDALIPVDYRSDPSRSKEGNVIDIGFVCIPEHLKVEDLKQDGAMDWIEIDFEKKCMVNDVFSFHMDHRLLLERAIDVAMMVK